MNWHELQKSGAFVDKKLRLSRRYFVYLKIDIE